MNSFMLEVLLESALNAWFIAALQYFDSRTKKVIIGCGVYLIYGRTI
jgi:hypothetical protein